MKYYHNIINEILGHALRYFTYIRIKMMTYIFWKFNDIIHNDKSLSSLKLKIN